MRQVVPRPCDAAEPTRRRLLQGLAAAGGLVISHGTLLAAFSFPRVAHGGVQRAFAVVADLERCTGCRSCEAVCSARNHPVEIDGRLLRGLGDPHLSNMRVHGFVPEVDVPVTCALCADAPCIASCPVKPDEQGRRALYRRPRLHTVVSDPERCIGCRSCAMVCAAKRGGVIVPNAGTGKPERTCTLCDGEPQCVLQCPYGALTLKRGPVDSDLHARPPREIAERMMERWYTLGNTEAES